MKRQIQILFLLVLVYLTGESLCYSENFVLRAPNVAIAPADVTVTVDLTSPPFFASPGGGVIIDCFSDGENTQFEYYYAESPVDPDPFTVTCHYEVPGFYCISACVDSDFLYAGCGRLYYDAVGGTCVPGGGGSLGKRATFHARVIQIRAAGAGDPYFYGFDGKVQQFDGLAGETYNYISTPTLQLNGLIGRSWDHSHSIKMGKTVTRSVGLSWSPYARVAYSCDYTGETVVTIMTRADENSEWDQVVLSQNVPSQKMHIEGATLVWQPHANFTRNVPHLSTHYVNSSLAITTAEYVIEILSAEMIPKFVQEAGKEQEHGFSFIDVEMVRMNPQECFEGAWGRTSCYHSSEEKFDPEIYNVHGDLFGTNFALNMFKQ